MGPTLALTSKVRVSALPESFGPAYITDETIYNTYVFTQTIILFHLLASKRIKFFRDASKLTRTGFWRD